MASEQPSITSVGFRPYVRALVAFLRKQHEEGDPPQTLSIEGGWGAGKSTFSAEVMKELRRNRVPVVEFKPWLHTNSDEMWVALAESVHRDLRGQLRRRDYVPRMVGLWIQKKFSWGHASFRLFRLFGEKRRRRWRLFNLILVFFVGVAFMLIGYNCVALREEIGEWLNSQAAFAIGIFTAVLGAIAAGAKVAPLILKKDEAVRTSRTPPLVYRLESEFAELVGALCPRDGFANRAVIFVDDLDRCTNVGVAETLRALSVLINEKVNATIVLAIDREAVAAALASDDNDIARFHIPVSRPAAGDEDDDGANAKAEHDHALRLGHRYLEKFIEATIRVPAFTGPYAQHLTRHQNDETLEEQPIPDDWIETVEFAIRRLKYHTDLVVTLFEGNPRRLKLWKREVHLRLYMLAATGRLSTKNTPHRRLVNVEQVLRFEALAILWPQLVRDLRRHPDLLRWLTAYAMRGKGPYPEHWRLGRVGPERWGYGALRYWIDRLNREDPVRTLLETGDDLTDSHSLIFPPLLIDLDVGLLLELRGNPEEPAAVTDRLGGTAKTSGAEVTKAIEDAKGTENTGFANSRDDTLSEAEPDESVPDEHARADDSGRSADTARDALFYDEELKAAEDAVERAMARHGEESPPYADAIDRLVLVLSQAGRLKEASNRAAQSLDINRRLHGDYHLNVADSMNNLAVVLRDLGDTERAQSLLEKSLNIYTRVYGVDHPQVATSMINLSNVLQDLGELDQSRDKIIQALKILRQLFGDEHLNVALPMSNLARVYQDLGELERSRDLFEKTLEMRRRILGEEHPDVATSMHNLACVLLNLGKIREARSIQENEIKLSRRLLGEEHPDIALSISNLAAILRASGEIEQSRALYLQSLKIYNHYFGDHHIHTIANQFRLLQLDTDRGDGRSGSGDLPNLVRIEMEALLGMALAKARAAAKYPVLIGRTLRTLPGGDPAAIVAEKEGPEAAARYTEIMDSAWYPDGPASPQNHGTRDGEPHD